MNSTSLGTVLLAACCALGSPGLTQAGQAQTAPAQEPPPPASPEKPMPELHALMHSVIAHQQAAEIAAHDYIYRESYHIDKLDGSGAVKQTELWEQDVFYLNGVQVKKMVSRDGKPLSPEQQRKEDSKVDKEVSKGLKKKEKQEGKDPDAEGEVRLSEMLKAGTFSNERRQSVAGRDTILVDFTGDPRAKTTMPIHEMEGTIAIDEQDSLVTEMHGDFFNDWKLLGGLVAKIDKGTKFSLGNVKINDEVWLPADFHLEGQARVLLLFSGHVRVLVTDRDYRKFKVNSTIVPGFTEVTPK